MPGAAWFTLGLLVGFATGMVVTAVLAAAGAADRDDEARRCNR